MLEFLGMTAGTGMSETTTAQHQDPSLEHADLLQELTARQREAVTSALRQSVSSGWPASRESVRILVAYAQGRISSQEYAAQILAALGYADARGATADLAPSPPPPAQSTSRFDASSGFDFLYNR
jgi:hypothetical protein